MLYYEKQCCLFLHAERDGEIAGSNFARCKTRTPKYLYASSTELAEDDCNDQQNQNRDDGDGDYSIRSHPETRVVSTPWPRIVHHIQRRNGSLPASHAPQCLDASVDVTFAIQQGILSVLNSVALDL